MYILLHEDKNEILVNLDKVYGFERVSKEDRRSKVIPVSNEIVQWECDESVDEIHRLIKKAQEYSR